jgi:ABC-2 type transport system ATP-binding protein
VHVTGFLGPNGAGKSTTLRLMLGLDRGDGVTLWDGKPLALHPVAPRVVGAQLDARLFHPNRTARAHLRMLSAASGVGRRRVDEVIAMMGLESVAKSKPRSFSMGMAQRLSLASAVLAEPSVLLLDEPANGLDPQSIRWLREYLRHYAEQGRAVLVSSHLLAEMQVMADHVVVISRGRLLADEPMGDLVGRSRASGVFVRSPDPTALEQAVRGALPDAELTVEGEGLTVTGATTDEVGRAAFDGGVVIAELTVRTASLEEAFLDLTESGQEFTLGGAS